MIPSGIPDELAAIFAEEADELLERLEQASVALRDAPLEEQVQVGGRMRRDLHTLKGSAGAVGLVEAAEACHVLEDFLAGFADGTPLESADLSELLRSLSGVRAICLGVAPSSAEPPPSAEPRGDEQASSSPTPATPATPAAAPTAATSGHETLRVAVTKVDALQTSLGELVVARLQSADLGRDAQGLRGELTHLQASWRELSAALRGVRGQLRPAVWIEVERGLAGFGQELRKAEQRASRMARRAVDQAAHVSVVSDALEGGIRQVRMLPVGPFFQGFTVAAAEAALSRDVAAKLSWDDHGLEADRAVVEGLRGELLHLVRNAVAHGIEPTEQRTRAGKPPVGTVRLEATLQGDHLQFLVVDDGAGIDRSAVSRRAEELGLGARDADLSDDDVLRLLCRAGFTTRSSADGVAGRGIGMDAVLNAVHALRGTLRMESDPGRGTTFRIRVPANVTTTEGLVVTVGPYRFGVALDVVRRVIRTSSSMIGSLEGSAVLYVEDEPLTITSLADLVGALEHAPPTDRGPSPTLLLEAGAGRLAVIVDDIPGQLQMVVRTLGSQFAAVSWLAGAAVEADGSVLPVLNPHGLIELARSRRRTVARPEPGAANTALVPTAPTASPSRRILVVDDSVTMRTLQRNILEAAGYEVLVAADGVEARDRLRTEGSIDLLITDLDMPRMNGLKLCAWVRSSSFSELPVLVVTSMGSDEERRLGLEAGADAYLVKGNFRQEHFLSTIRRLGG